MFSYGTLGFAVKGQLVYYFTGAPLFDKATGERLRGAESTVKGEAKGLEALHLVTYDLARSRFADHGPSSSPFRAPLSAARTLKRHRSIPGHTLSLRQERLRAACGPRREERGPEMPPRKRRFAGPVTFDDGSFPTYVNSLAVGDDGWVYALGRMRSGLTDLLRVPNPHARPLAPTAP